MHENMQNILHNARRLICSINICGKYAICGFLPNMLYATYDAFTCLHIIFFNYLFYFIYYLFYLLFITFYLLFLFIILLLLLLLLLVKS